MTDDEVPSHPIAKCDGCGAAARRRPEYPCPDFWFYLESKRQSDPNQMYVVWACSEECRDKLWKQGPGTPWIDEDGSKRLHARKLKR